jgi:hypothetical protein
MGDVMQTNKMKSTSGRSSNARSQLAIPECPQALIRNQRISTEPLYAANSSMSTDLGVSRTRQALGKQRDAAIERKLASYSGPSAHSQREVANRLDAEAAALLTPVGPPIVRSCEVFAMPDDSGPVYEIQNTLRNPDQAAIDASIKRTDLLWEAPADLLALAVDTATSAKADNSLEKMLGHQLALLHMLIMKTGSRALEFEKRRGSYGQGFQRDDSIELGRLTNAVGRLTAAFQGGLLTMQRLKTGASQTVTVRHVTVQAGAQAVIGNVRAGGQSLYRPRRGDQRK